MAAPPSEISLRVGSGLRVDSLLRIFPMAAPPVGECVVKCDLQRAAQRDDCGPDQSNNEEQDQQENGKSKIDGDEKQEHQT